MKVTLETAKNVLVNCIKDRFYRNAFRNVVERALNEADMNDIELEETEAIEVHAYGLTISFTWDMITIVNEKTNACCDLTCAEKLGSVIR